MTDILIDLNRRLRTLRKDEFLSIGCADLKAWRDEIERLRVYAPKEYQFPANLFRGRKKQIVEAIHKAGSRGVTSERLFEIVYGGDRDGGPVTGVKILAVHVWAINKQLKPHGVVIHHTGIGRGGADGVYILKPI